MTQIGPMRAALLSGAAGAVGAASGWLAGTYARSVDWRIWQMDDALAVAAGAVGAVAGARLVAGVLASLLAIARGARPPRWAGPLARGLALALAGALLGTTAHASPRHGLDVPDAGWAPRTIETAPPAEAPPEPAPPEVGAARAETVHVVAPGDTLWDIAAESLGGDPGAAEIAAAWPVVYAANRATVGDDPGLILPGTSLVIPDPLSGARS